MLDENSLLDLVTPLLTGGSSRAVIFDWDGTFADSTRTNYAAMRDAAQSAGGIVEESWFRAHSGISTKEMLHMLFADADDTLIDVLAQRRDHAFAAASHQVQPFDDTLTLARLCHDLHVETAIGSGGLRVGIERHLQSWNLTSLFPVIVGREDVDNGKPAPDCFLKVSAMLEVEPEACLVIEDSDQGLAAAQEAGMAAIDVRPLNRSAS